MLQNARISVPYTEKCSFDSSYFIWSVPRAPSGSAWRSRRPAIVRGSSKTSKRPKAGSRCPVPRTTGTTDRSLAAPSSLAPKEPCGKAAQQRTQQLLRRDQRAADPRIHRVNLRPNVDQRPVQQLTFRSQRTTRRYALVTVIMTNPGPRHVADPTHRDDAGCYSLATCSASARNGACARSCIST